MNPCESISTFLNCFLLTKTVYVIAVLLKGIPFGAVGPPFSVISNDKYALQSRTSVLGIPVSVIFCGMIIYPF
ncbi:hypothetical protein B7492_32150 (plasmid) [Bacillus mycoides]|uniref:Uncharacterized protein n=1 Tax=Bacillus mycoides TaxID=1405 RepID=A0A1W6AIK5_BACMY|nr:hypothetical protein B7492_32150 [Bacillus mycoides]